MLRRGKLKKGILELEIEEMNAWLSRVCRARRRRSTDRPTSSYPASSQPLLLLLLAPPSIPRPVVRTRLPHRGWARRPRHQTGRRRPASEQRGDCERPGASSSRVLMSRAVRRR
ncbi:hypothetical protein BRADI_4g33474v3 [Brachypodium distachyon]|uniref:Uncharacterized protein n=1 Tax=Brachypodium distachyon TaxID=15368 RepID=A0A0Q3ET72_BRADI|nr:hypothetical protein BRADI_4g33474v3 [Brachypodium distachyon]